MGLHTIITSLAATTMLQVDRRGAAPSGKESSPFWPTNIYIEDIRIEYKTAVQGKRYAYCLTFIYFLVRKWGDK